MEVFRELMAGLAKVKTLPVDDKMISPALLAEPSKAPGSLQQSKDEEPSVSPAGGVDEGSVSQNDGRLGGAADGALRRSADQS
jgi:hypothetical protein